MKILGCSDPMAFIFSSKDRGAEGIPKILLVYLQHSKYRNRCFVVEDIPLWEGLVRELMSKFKQWKGYEAYGKLYRLGRG